MVWTETIYYCSECNCKITNMTTEGRLNHEAKCIGERMAKETIKKLKGAKS